MPVADWSTTIPMLRCLSIATTANANAAIAGGIDLWLRLVRRRPRLNCWRLARRYFLGAAPSTT